MGGREGEGKGMSYDYEDTKKCVRNLVMVIAIFLS